MREEDAAFSERKAHTNIPLLKNNKNTLNQVSASVKAFSERLLNGSLKLDVSDINGVANQMVFEVNLLAGRLLILQHKLIEVLRASPRHIVENLHAEHRERMREKWNGSILRNVVPTRDFALPSEENIGDTHKKMAKSKRATDSNFEESELLKVEDLSVFG